MPYLSKHDARRRREGSPFDGDYPVDGELLELLDDYSLWEKLKIEGESRNARLVNLIRYFDDLASEAEPEIDWGPPVPERHARLRFELDSATYAILMKWKASWNVSKAETFRAILYTLVDGFPATRASLARIRLSRRRTCPRSRAARGS